MPWAFLRSLLEIPGKWKFQEDFVAMCDFFKNLSIRNHHQKSKLISDDLCIFVCMFGFKWCVHLQSSGCLRYSDAQTKDETSGKKALQATGVVKVNLWHFWNSKSQSIT